MYQECDKLGTNAVKTTALVGQLGMMVGDNPHIDNSLLKQLTVFLDPSGDDGYLKRDEFVESGLRVSLNKLAVLQTLKLDQNS